jgi:urease accessory protein
MTRTTALLALMQISDSAFPSGAFVHSYGLEQPVRERRIKCAEEVDRFAASVLEALAGADARAAYAAACARSLEEVIEVDHALFAMKAAAELRDACVSTGRRFLDEALILPEAQGLAGYCAAVQSKATPCCYPVAYGVVCRDLGVDPADVPGAFLLGAVTALLQSALRLMRVSHRDVQSALHTLRPRIAVIAEGIVSPTDVRSAPSHSLRTFNPLQDIASMRHERAEARLFAS